MAKGLSIAEPPKRRRDTTVSPETSRAEQPAEPVVSSPSMFNQTREGDKVQFNKRIDKSVADGYAIMAVKTGKKVPELLKEGLEALEAKYGKV